MVWNKGLTSSTDNRVKRIAEKNSKLFSEHPERFLERNKKISEKTKGRIPWNKGKILGKQNEELIRKRTRNSNYSRSFINYYKEKHPLLFKVDKVRENSNKEIEVECKTCKKFFVVDRQQLHERIRAIEGNVGFAENNLYCSEECKHTCSVFRKRTDKLNNIFYTPEEYQSFREFVLERDNYQCQYCEKPANHVHHERPQKLEPFFALDPDLAWSVCKECHYKYGHQDECSTGQLASKQC